MKYCSKCGHELQDDAKFCDACGACVDVNPTSNNIYNSQPTIDASNNYKGSNWWLVAGLFIPILGLILGLIWNEKDGLEKQANGKKALKGAIIGIIIDTILSIVFVILWFFFFSGLIKEIVNAPVVQTVSLVLNLL